MIVLGFLAIIGFVVGQFVPLGYGLGAPTINNLCATSFGTEVQAASFRVAHDCALARGVDVGSWLLLAAGLVLTIGGAWTRRRGPDGY